MRTIACTEFRRRASAMLDLVEKGETIRILRHGKVVAELAPPNDDKRVPHWKRPIKPLVVPGASLSQAILDERESGL